MAAPTALLVMITSSRTAAAQESADALYNRGLAEMLAGRHDTGCPAIAESYKLDPLPGTLFTLAECEAQRGRLATAVAYYDAYLALFSALPRERQERQRGRELIAAQQRALLGPQTPLLSVTLGSGAPSGTVVRRDGQEIAADQLSIALPVDPGEHIVTAQAPGRPLAELRVALDRGERKSIVIEVPPASEALPVVPVEPPRVASPPSASPVPAGASAPKDGAPLGTQRIIGLIIGGAGAAGLIAGGVMGGLAIGEKATIKSNCEEVGPDLVDCNSTGKAAADRAQTLGTASTIGIGIGVAMVGLGVVLYATAPSRQRAPSAPGASRRETLHVGLAAGGNTTIAVHLGGSW